MIYSMKKAIYKRYAFLLLLLASLTAAGQSLRIKNISLQPNDMTAIIQPCLDANQDTCALLKIKTDHLGGVQFPNHSQYIKSSYSDGIYSVYMPAISRKLDIQHKDYLSIQLDMSNYGYKRLRKGKTYLVILEVPKINDLKSSLIIKVEPRFSTIILDEQEFVSSPNGTFKFSISPGNHTYMVSSPNYYSKNGSVLVGNAEVKTMTVKLQPIMHKVLIGSNVDNARVYVDNLDYGGVGKLLIPQGNHTIRVQADGYVDEEKDVSINSYTGSLSFVLKENKKVTHIHATPVKIYSYSSSVYKNKKRIKDWTNGATIMFMPGKYMLEDDDGNTKKIEVGTEPLEIHL